MGQTMITYSNGAIKIPVEKLQGNVPQINTEFVQHRLSQDEFKQFWDRMKMRVGTYFTVQKFLVVLILLAAISFIIFQAATRFYFNPPAYYSYVVSIVTIAVLSTVMATLIRKKMVAFVTAENNEIWAARGLYWQFLGWGRFSSLELQVIPSTNNYQPPSQYQPYVQGTMPDNYMQQQGGVPNPYVQPTNFYPQMQPVNYGQPQYQPHYEQQQPQQYQVYPTTNNYGQQPNYALNQP